MSNRTGHMVGREVFMQHIAQRLGRQEPLAVAPVHPYRGVPEHYEAISLSPEENLDVFISNWTALTGKVLLVKQADAEQAIQAYVQHICREFGVTRAVMWDTEPLHGLGIEAAMAQAGVALVPWRELAPEELSKLESAAALAEADARALATSAQEQAKLSPLLTAAERCQLGIVWPEYAIANTGTLTLFAQGAQGRSVSLLPDILLAIFRADQVVTRMGQMFDRLRHTYPDVRHLPSSINLITGPSRSADIENDLTIGIHGPGKVHAVIIV